MGVLSGSVRSRRVQSAVGRPRRRALRRPVAGISLRGGAKSEDGRGTESEKDTDAGSGQRGLSLREGSPEFMFKHQG